jgi:hypothetical protein
VEYYEIPLLKDVAALKFKHCVDSPDFCKQGFHEIIKQIYDQTLPTDHGLSELILARAVKETAARSPSYQPSALLEVEKAVKDVFEFAWDFVVEASKGFRVCNICDEMFSEDKTPVHERGILKCRECCNDERVKAHKQAQDANAGNQNWVDNMKICSDCENGQKGWGIAGDHW